MTRLELLRALLERALAQESDAVARKPFLRAIFAVGITHVGGSIDDLVAAVEGETGLASPNVVLLKLYLDHASRPRRALTAENNAAAQAVVNGLDRSEDRPVVTSFLKHSRWLGSRAPPPAGLRPALERTLAKTTPESVVANAAELFRMPMVYDYEIAAAARRLIDVAVASEDRALMLETASLLLDNADRIKILAHRLRFVAPCSRVLRPTRDAALAARLANAAVALLPPQTGIGPRDVVVASVELAEQLASIDDVAPLGVFVSALVEGAKADPTGLLRAFAARCFVLLRDEAQAKANLAEARAALEQKRSPVDRFATAVELCGAVACLSFSERIGECELLVDVLPKLTDAFTTKRYFAAHEIGMAEAIVDAVTHDA